MNEFDKLFCPKISSKEINNLMKAAKETKFYKTITSQPCEMCKVRNGHLAICSKEVKDEKIRR
jgi:hypothetical protein